jgi:dGTPase
MIEDVIAETANRLAALKPGSSAQVREAARAVVGFSQGMAQADAAIKGFLRPRMYRHPKVVRVMDEAEGVVRGLFAHYVATPADLPAEWRDGLADADEGTRARRIADYIAGMTDRYAQVEHTKYFPETPELR